MSMCVHTYKFLGVVHIKYELHDIYLAEFIPFVCKVNSEACSNVYLYLVAK